MTAMTTKMATNMTATPTPIPTTAPWDKPPPPLSSSSPPSSAPSASDVVDAPVSMVEEASEVDETAVLDSEAGVSCVYVRKP
jgi:hypothetical protein